MVHLLEELRDLAREQAARHQRVLTIQEQMVANQNQAIAHQRDVVENQLKAFRRFRPVIGGILGLIIVILLILLWLVIRIATPYLRS
jgi:t-SNARE complex subunit (syntaxin)